MTGALTVTLLFGAAIGLFLAFAFLFKRERGVGETLLALTLLTLAIELALQCYLRTGLYRTFPYLLGFDRSLPLLYGPALYLLAGAATGTIRRLRPAQLVHLLPFSLHFLLMLPFHIKSPATKIFLQEQFIPGVASIEPHPAPLFIVKLLVLLCYLIAAFVAVGRHERLIREFFSAIERYELSWFRLLLLVPAAQIVILLATIVTYGFFQPGFVRVEMPDGYFVALILFIVTAGIQIIRTPGLWRSAVDIETLFDPPPVDQTDDGDAKYQKTRIDPALAEQYKKRLLAYMDAERPYKDPLLTLPQLAKRLNAPAHHLSQVINGLVGQNFYAFVNGYRIEYAKQILAQGGPAAENILAVAYESGFNSKSAFNTYFRKQTGVTPSEFKRSAAKSG